MVERAEEVVKVIIHVSGVQLHTIYPHNQWNTFDFEWNTQTFNRFKQQIAAQFEPSMYRWLVL